MTCMGIGCFQIYLGALIIILAVKFENYIDDMKRVLNGVVTDRRNVVIGQLKSFDATRGRVAHDPTVFEKCFWGDGHVICLPLKEPPFGIQHDTGY